MADKDIDAVMAAQADLVEVVHTLRQVVCEGLTAGACTWCGPSYSGERGSDAGTLCRRRQKAWWLALPDRTRFARMPQLADVDHVEVEGSGAARYTLSRTGEVYACSCPAWRNQGATIDRRTCKHLRKYLGDAVETARVGAAAQKPVKATKARATAGADGGGEPTVGSAPPLLLAHAGKSDQAPAGRWMSEKFDGIRAYGDGAGFVSRLGNRFATPSWFVAGLPREPLDGERWIGRKEFQRTTSVVRSGGAGEAWRTLRYLGFDAPAHAGPFGERVAHVRALLTRGHAFAAWHPHERCADVLHLRAELARVEALGGEGLMLGHPGKRCACSDAATSWRVDSRSSRVGARRVGSAGAAPSTRPGAPHTHRTPTRPPGCGAAVGRTGSLRAWRSPPSD